MLNPADGRDAEGRKFGGASRQPRHGPTGAKPVTTPDLSLTPTDDLIQALKARCDAMIFVSTCKRVEGERDEERSAWKGHVTLCAGMATDLIREMQDWARTPAGPDA